jgi:heptosyltransferase-2
MTRRIALFLPNWIGDVVMATPAIRAIRQHFSNAEILAVARSYVKGVVDGCPWLDEFISIGKGSAYSLVHDSLRLRRRRIDLAILFPNSFRSALVAKLAGCRRRIGFNRYGRGILLTDRIDHRRGPNGNFAPSPILLDYNRLAKKAGAVVDSNRMELFTSNQEEALADAVWHRAGFDRTTEVICLNPGAAFGSAKLWPKEHFAALARRLVRERAAGILILCGPSERELARQIEREASSPFVYSLANESVSLGLTKACVRRCSLLVTTDSGPRHFAAAFNRPVVSLFGPTHIEWTQTFHPLEKLLQIRVPCGPCQQRVCPIDHRCMRDLSPEWVFHEAIDSLNMGNTFKSMEEAHVA